jgi:DNA mismatch repair protein MutS2
MGIPGSSHAFDIAERYKLPSKIIAHARSLAGSKSSRLEELIDSLNRKEQELMQKKAETEKELGKARIERMDFERQNNELNLHKKEILSKASNEADTLLSGVNTYIEKAIREAREAAAPPKKDEPKKPDLSILRAKQKEELKDLQAKVDEHKVTTNKEEIEDEIPFSVGVKVRLLTNPDRIGDIITLKGNEAEVAFGSVTMRVKTDKLQSVSKKESRKEERSTLRTTTYFDEQFSPRIDLRGLYGDEGVLQVEKFLSDAIARGLDKVELIHGMGTGALGRRIQQELKKHPSVKSFRYGEPNEGGAGVTVVELK